jgi:hypothetical protein
MEKPADGWIPVRSLVILELTKVEDFLHGEECNGDPEMSAHEELDCDHKCDQCPEGGEDCPNHDVDLCFIEHCDCSLGPPLRALALLRGMPISSNPAAVIAQGQPSERVGQAEQRVAVLEAERDGALEAEARSRVELGQERAVVDELFQDVDRLREGAKEAELFLRTIGLDHPRCAGVAASLRSILADTEWAQRTKVTKKEA